jgi:SAM-dependent methyltransferase
MERTPHERAAADASAFQEPGVVAAYGRRPPYPASLFPILTGLIAPESRRVLDIGCGTGELARPLVARVEGVDAIDLSLAMIEAGRRLPNGDHPRLRWRHGRAEEAPLDPPYGLVTAGASLHWMDWGIVLPRLRAALVPGGFLAIVVGEVVPGPWSLLGEIVARYRTDSYREQPRDLVSELVHRRIFRVVGSATTDAISFEQSVEDCIESYHSRPGFARERLGSARAAAFDHEARQHLLGRYGDGWIRLQVAASVVWGLPGAG